MPLISGAITHQGVVIDLVVGVPASVRHAAIQSQLHVPPDLYLRGVVDTGAAVTGLSPRVISQLGLRASDQIAISTPSTTLGSPHRADRFEVSLSLVAGGTKHLFAETLVIAADCFPPEEHIDALIGRDVLDHCSFQYWGQARQFQFAF